MGLQVYHNNPVCLYQGGGDGQSNVDYPHYYCSEEKTMPVSHLYGIEISVGVL